MTEEKKVSRQRRWQLKMEAIGLCRQCGAEYSKVGRTLCRVCLAKQATYNANYYRKIKVDNRAKVDA